MASRLRVDEQGFVVIDESRGYTPIRASGTPDGGSPEYGNGGLFGICGQSRTLLNATISPQGIEAWLDWVGSDVQSPEYDSFTYIGTSTTGQTGMCSDCGKPTRRACAQSACFGRVCQQTNEHALDQLGLRANFGVQKKALFGNITGPSGNVLVPQGQIIRDALSLDIMSAGFNLQSALAVNNWTGNPAANVGGYWEHPGFQLLINTGKYDVHTGILCNGLDSYIYNYNAIVGAIGSPSIVQALARGLRTIKYRITGAGLNSESAVTGLVMHQRTYDCVLDAVACEYGLVCSNTTSSAPPRNDAMAIAEFRDSMMARQVIKVDGKFYPVIIDNMMPGTWVPVGNQSAWQGSIYGLTKIVNGETIIWGEYQDFTTTAGAAIQELRELAAFNQAMVTDGGRFLVAWTASGGFCVDARILAKTRLLATMPQFSFRITNVRCLDTGYYPDVTGQSGSYPIGGGRSVTPYPGMYGDCGALGIIS